MSVALQTAPAIRKGGGEDSKDANRRPAEPAAPAVKSGPPIDPKYAKPETSGLEFELNAVYLQGLLLFLLLLLVQE